MHVSTMFIFGVPMNWATNWPGRAVVEFERGDDDLFDETITQWTTTRSARAGALRPGRDVMVVAPRSRCSLAISTRSGFLSAFGQPWRRG